jgi:hypothetical protein
VKFFITVILIFLAGAVNAQSPVVDTIKLTPNNLSKISLSNYGNLLENHIFLNYSGTPQVKQLLEKNRNNKTIIFYLLLILFFFLGTLRTFYKKYLDTLFQVFFNTTLRQSQLTDQLVQAKLPSLLFNILFVLGSGAYLFAVYNFLKGASQSANKYSNTKVFFVCIASIAVCYTVKYIMLYFVGWLTNSKILSGTYIFMVFLLNKVLGIFLLFATPIILFGSNITASYAVLFSLICVGLILLLRFFRSYALLKQSLKVSTFHFFIYVLGLELLPLGIIFKIGMNIFATNA